MSVTAGVGLAVAKAAVVDIHALVAAYAVVVAFVSASVAVGGVVVIVVVVVLAPPRRILRPQACKDGL